MSFTFIPASCHFHSPYPKAFLGIFLIGLSFTLVSCDPEDEINRYFAQSGLTRLAVLRTDVQPGTLILTRGNEAFLGDHILDYVDREADPDHDYGTFAGSAKDEVDAVLRRFHSQTQLSAQTALEFLMSVFRLAPEVDVGLTGTVKINLPDAKVRKMKVASLEKFLTRKDSHLFRTKVREWAKQDLTPYVAYEVFRAKSLTIVAEDGKDVAPSLAVGATANLPVKAEGKVAYKKTAGNELKVAGDRYVAFAVKTARLLSGTTDDKDAVVVDRTQFVKPKEWGIKSAGTDDQYAAPLAKGFAPVDLPIQPAS
jgi:hypothetical protein